MTTIRTLVFSLLIALAIASTAVAQKHPNLELGFKPEKLYQLSDLDSVNLFNGNLIIRIPIGQQYPVNADFGYHLTLVYNAKMWDYTKQDADGLSYYKARPSRSSNAGVGWRVSLGRLIPPYSSTSLVYPETNPEWLYESPDGAESKFGDARIRVAEMTASTMKLEFPNGATHTFSKSGTRWRLTSVTDRFANGFTVAYEADPIDTSRDRTWTITDSLGRVQIVNFLNWPAVSDSIERGQYIMSIVLKGPGGGNATYGFAYTPTFLNWGCQNTWSGAGTGSTLPLLTKITLPDTDQSTFEFTYHHSASGGCDEGALDTMTLPTGGTVAYTYQQYALPESHCNPVPIIAQSLGLRKKTTSDGTWDYIHDVGPAKTVPLSSLPTGYCGAQGPEVPGGPAAAEIVWPSRWARTAVLSPPAMQNGSLKRGRTDNFFNTWMWPNDGTLTDEFDGAPSKTPDTTTIVKGDRYGLPITTGAPSEANARNALTTASADVSARDDASAADYRLLSTRAMDGCDNDETGNCTNGKLLQTTYLRYVAGHDYNPLDLTGFSMSSTLVDSTRVVNNDDNGCGTGVPCYVQTTKSEALRTGVFRRTEQTSTFPLSVTSTDYTNYIDWTAADVSNLAKPWVLDLFTEQWHEENGVRRHTTACFDTASGFLQMTRVRADAKSTSNSHDVVTVYDRGLNGNVKWEKTYGGDSGNVASTLVGSTGGLDNCTQPASAPLFITGYTYFGGTMESASHYNPAIFNENSPAASLVLKRADYDIDASTGLVTNSRDVAGVTTHFAYDSASRLMSVTSPGTAPISYAYSKATSTTKARATVTVTPSSEVFPLSSVFIFDAMGRVTQKTEMMPLLANESTYRWAVTKTTFDGLGRVASVSEPQDAGTTVPEPAAFTPAHVTTFEYDGLGRKTKVTSPDGAAHPLTTSYLGTRKITRTAWVAMITVPAASETSTSTVEEYDGAGRLRNVTQKSGPSTVVTPTAAEVRTEYDYDAGGRLSSVKMRGAEGIVQSRAFDYDGRGFLIWESQPESGMRSYTYDALGNVLTRSQSAAHTIFDLRYSYDAAARLRLVEGIAPDSTPQNPVYRPLKEFEYGTDSVPSTNLRKGKLINAIRYNYPPEKDSGFTQQFRYYLEKEIYRVTEAYQYNDAAGRRTDRTTTIDVFGSISFPQSWARVKQLTQSVAYNDLGAVSATNYPMCVDCGALDSSPTRTITPTFDRGRTIAVPGFVNDISFWPNGMRNVLRHSNLVADTQELDDSGMARPKSIRSALSAACVAPSVVIAPQGGTYTSGTFHLSVVASGTDVTYQWYDATASPAVAIAGATASSYDVAPTSARTYYVELSNSCGAQIRTINSSVATVSPTCVATTVVGVSGTLNGDRTVQLKASPNGTGPFTCTWYRSSDNANVGTGTQLTLDAIAVSTSYYAIASNACGSAVTSGTVSVVTPLATPAGLVATLNVSNTIDVSWLPVPETTTYTLERRSGASWVTVASQSATTFNDPDVTAGQCYAYRVRSNGSSNRQSAYSNVDLATRMTFTPVVAGQTITVAHYAELLQAVNAVRAAVGWAAVTWDDILAPGRPVPAPGTAISAYHIIAPRARMNEAMQALGIATPGYTDLDPTFVVIKAAHVAELQMRAK